MFEPLPSSVQELAGLVIELRAAKAGLREVIAAQAERIAAQDAALAALAAALAELKQRAGQGLLDLEQATVLGFALPQARAPLVTALLGARPR